MQRTLCFDDVLLTPQYSNIESRSNVDLSVTDETDIPVKFHSRSSSLTCPIVGSPMDTVMSAEAAVVLSTAGGFGVFHRYCTIDEAITTYSKFLELTSENAGDCQNAMVAIGATGDYLERANALYNHGCRSFCIDVAHGHHISVREALKTMRLKFGDDVHIMTGNVATLEAFNDLADWGSNSIRVGIGGGCFIPGTLVTMSNGTKKPIETVKVGDFVLTHTREAKEVINLFERPFADLLVRINNSLTCTLNHEIYVIENKNTHHVNDENIHEFAKWIPAANLNENYSLVEIKIKGIFKFHPIKSAETFHSEGHYVHDITVDDNSSYVAEGYVVHNSMCSTRIRTGHGVPTLQSIMDCTKSDRDVFLVADGGIRNSGDAVKALAAGADMIMLGSILAGHAECPGALVDDKGFTYGSSGTSLVLAAANIPLFKKFRGMASREAQLQWRGRVSTVEGESTMIPYKGHMLNTITDLLEGIRSGLSYSGASTIRELRNKAKFVMVTPQGVQENIPHGKR